MRMKQPKTLESKTFHTFPEMGGGIFVKHFELDLPGLIFASSPVRAKGFGTVRAKGFGTHRPTQIVLFCFAMASNRVLWLALTSPAV